jgi:thiol-disulfide isomerase/thioredoxin
VAGLHNHALIALWGVLGSPPEKGGRHNALRHVPASRRIRANTQPPLRKLISISKSRRDLRQQFDPATLKGKVVLVDFWATWCGLCLAELPNVTKNYEKYHDRGFEVVGISLDDDKATLETFLEKEKIPWPTLFDEGNDQQGFKNPMAVYYSVWGVPTAILTNKKGEVISLDARGDELDRNLEILLGHAEK